MSKIVFHTRVYNGERTLRRTMDSVLSQTHRDLTYYVFDNGSTDGTRAIIEEYAARDDRVISVYYDANDRYLLSNTSIPYIVAHESDNTWVADLDADDTYAPEFAEKLLAFAESEDLDVASGGITEVNVETGEVTGQRLLKEDLIVESDGFSQLFPIYYFFVNTYWGKIFKVSVLKQASLEFVVTFKYSADTIQSLETLLYAERFGILAEPLHTYYISAKGGWHSYAEGRAESDEKLLLYCKDYLQRKCGSVSKANENFLYGGYYLNLLRTLKAAFHARIPLSRKFGVIGEILRNKSTNPVTFIKGLRGAFVLLRNKK